MLEGIFNPSANAQDRDAARRIIRVPTWNDRRLAFTTYKNARTPRPHHTGVTTWDKIITSLSRRDLRPDEDGLAFGFVRLKPETSRVNENVESVSACVLNIVDGTPLEALAPRIADWEYMAYSTHSHTATHPKYTLVFPLARDCLPDEWPRLRRLVNQLVGDHADPSAKDIARLFYIPSCPVERQAEAFAHHHSQARSGFRTEWFNPDQLLKLQAAGEGGL